MLGLNPYPKFSLLLKARENSSLGFFSGYKVYPFYSSHRRGGRKKMFDERDRAGKNSR